LTRTTYNRRMATGLLDHTLLSVHDPETGRYDAKRLAEVLVITQKEMAKIVGYSPRGLSKNPTSPRLQSDLERLVRLVTRLRELLDGDMGLVRIWLKTPHPALGGNKPLAYLEDGRLDLVEGLVQAIETGQPD
jgi:uncharacterized protein (DUF2384 family)